MEFVQFHPTGMVWPISVRGILVTEGVRGEGGVLRNREGRRFMFDEIPDLYKEQKRTTKRRAGAIRRVTGMRAGRLNCSPATTSHAASIARSRQDAARPHGGVFLDIAWIKQHIPKAEEHIKRKLPSMYHQFKQLADLDITKEPMEVGPTTHYMMGGIRVDGDSQMSNVPGCLPREKRQLDCTVRTGWAAIRSRTWWYRTARWPVCGRIRQEKRAPWGSG